MNKRTNTKIRLAIAFFVMASLGACSRGNGDQEVATSTTNTSAQSDEDRAVAEGKKIGHVLPFKICRLAVNDQFTNRYTLEQAEIRVSASAKPEDWFATAASAAEYLADAGVAEAVELNVTRDDLPPEGVAGQYAWLAQINIGRDAEQSNGQKLPYDWSSFKPIFRSAERAAPWESIAIRDAFDALPERLQDQDKAREAAARIKKQMGLNYLPDLSLTGPVFSGNALENRKLNDYHVEAGADAVKQLAHLKELARGEPIHDLECPDWHI
ncbi:hypothetical protein [Burkholderia gladioli]|uniref:hypothetical protein n=1 Tax=Burkholderia gladioli TaxID=28095 RepID=UPI000FD8997E|nr:hypothetical protein [Burkholderia gladioli]MBJ9712749.1 hypothetical protein [Burkholderia gladioli]MBU9168200.1 hypothetical protein [Burkholderia gladioli]MBU9198075.1 hypothetical protein [Burkholderia gladioli]MBU9425156.1 hypothetical protein [Burkholderia gladioli]MDN8062233.1 hypothetical protein [Burkholderia gladioli]